MAIESMGGGNAPVCTYLYEGRCVFRRGVDTPSLSETQGGRSKTLENAGGFSLSGRGKLVDPSLVTEGLCKARLRFENFRGIYQEANCNEYAANEPEINLIY